MKHTRFAITHLNDSDVRTLTFRPQYQHNFARELEARFRLSNLQATEAYLLSHLIGVKGVETLKVSEIETDEHGNALNIYEPFQSLTKAAEEAAALIGNKIRSRTLKENTPVHEALPEAGNYFFQFLGDPANGTRGAYRSADTIRALAPWGDPIETESTLPAGTKILGPIKLSQ